jgi:N-acetylglucosamine kinase-like BadF-type ATPase
VDGGGSKTHALVIDETGHARGFGEGGGSNHQVCGIRSAMSAVEQAVRGALEKARLSPEVVDTGCFCMAGADFPEDYALLQEGVEQLELARSVIIKCDTMAALRAGLTRPWGVVVICGYGFNAAGRGKDGRETAFPALGWISGDWGCGGDLSREIIRAVMRAWDGRGRPTRLTGLVLEATQTPSEEALLMKLYRGEVDEQAVLALVPLLFEAAVDGDEVSAELVTAMGREAGLSANVIIQRLGLEEEDVEVVLAGSIFKGKGPLLLDTVAEVVRQKAPGARLVPLKQEPVFGAALLALEAMGVPVTERVHDELERTA